MFTCVHKKIFIPLLISWNRYSCLHVCIKNIFIPLLISWKRYSCLHACIKKNIPLLISTCCCHRKDVVQQIRKLKNLMSHVLTFKQMENGEKITMDGYNRLVFECGCTVEKLDEKLAGVKGQLSKRAKRSA